MVQSRFVHTARDIGELPSGQRPECRWHGESVGCTGGPWLQFGVDRWNLLRFTPGRRNAANADVRQRDDISGRLRLHQLERDCRRGTYIDPEVSSGANRWMLSVPSSDSRGRCGHPIKLPTMLAGPPFALPVWWPRTDGRSDRRRGSTRIQAAAPSGQERHDRDETEHEGTEQRDVEDEVATIGRGG